MMKTTLLDSRDSVEVLLEKEGNIPAGHKIAYQSKTAFFRQSDNSKWIAEAEKVFKQISL